MTPVPAHGDCHSSLKSPWSSPLIGAFLRAGMALALFAAFPLMAGCHNDQQMTDRHEQILQEEDE